MDRIEQLMDTDVTLELPAKFWALIRNVLNQDLVRTAAQVAAAKLDNDDEGAADMSGHGLCLIDVLEVLEVAFKKDPTLAELTAKANAAFPVSETVQ